VFSISSLNTNEYQLYKKMMKSRKREDRGYHESRIGGYKITFYDSGYNPSHWIRDATSGQRTDSRIGSMDEDLYFKVKLATGEGGPFTLFYYSPEEHERHFRCSLDLETKRNWLVKRNARVSLKPLNI
jgi:hypothetical protein